MIVYFDPSCIVKWFFVESGSDMAEEARTKAEVAVTSLLAFPEVCSAIRRAHDEKRCSKEEMAFARNAFLEAWNDLTWIRPNEDLVLETRSLIFEHGLRGYDAVHLASALTMKREARAEILFSCFDRKLNRAAVAEGLHVHTGLIAGPLE